MHVLFLHVYEPSHTVNCAAVVSILFYSLSYISNMNVRPSLDDKKNKFDIKKHCVLCCKGESKYKLVSTESGMRNLRHAAQDQNDFAVLSRICIGTLYYHVKNYACYYLQILYS